MPIRFKGSACNKCGSNGHLSSEHDAQADPDGYAVFGRYPKGFLEYVVRTRMLGHVRRDEILHVCSGTLTEKWTVDLRQQARPRVLADGAALPFVDGSFKAVMMDPPYSETYARNLYGVENPRPIDPIFTMKALVAYSGLSRATLRGYMNRPKDPLPAYRVDDGKVLVRKSEFDAWLARFRYRPSSAELDAIVKKVVEAVR